MCCCTCRQLGGCVHGLLRAELGVSGGCSQCDRVGGSVRDGYRFALGVLAYRLGSASALGVGARCRFASLRARRPRVASAPCWLAASVASPRPRLRRLASARLRIGPRRPRSASLRLVSRSARPSAPPRLASLRPARRLKIRLRAVVAPMLVQLPTKFEANPVGCWPRASGAPRGGADAPTGQDRWRRQSGSGATGWCATNQANEIGNEPEERTARW